jgi:dTDP-glucose pyrophosphorylase
MKQLHQMTVKQNATILETLEAIDRGLLGIALVVDEDFKLIGTVTDGDIRRAIIKKAPLDSSIESIMSHEPIKASTGTSAYNLVSIMKSKVINQIPIVNEHGHLIDIKTIAELVKGEEKDNLLVIMAGGLGTRLRPFTHTTPKPLLPIGNKPILESIIEHAKTYGLTNIIISLNYLSESIQKYFGDGSNFGVKINYVQEKQSLGTAGALSLIDKEFYQMLNNDVFVINGDILTRINFDTMLQQHKDDSNELTVGTRYYKTQIPYGIINLQNRKIQSIEEKPLLEYVINAGIYILSPQAIKLIPAGKSYHMTDLIDVLISKNKSVGSFMITDYWLDVGKINDYYKANFEMSEYFV